MRTPLVITLTLLTAACSAEAEVGKGPQTPAQSPPIASSPPPSPKPAQSLAATPLGGPYAGRDAACTALTNWVATALGWKGATCAESPVDLGAGAPFAAALLRVAEQPPSDPRTAGSGVWYMAIHRGDVWFTVPAPLDKINSGAGHTYLPAITPAQAAVVAHAGAPRVLVILNDKTDSICNVCDGPERQTRTPARATQLVLVCAHAGDKPACTQPLSVDVGTKVTLRADDVLDAAQVYSVTF
jgi:hypothetical protein